MKSRFLILMTAVLFGNTLLAQCGLILNTSFGDPNAVPHELYEPNGIIKIGDKVIVSESSGALLKVLKKSGNQMMEVSTFGSYGAGQGQFKGPQFIAKDSLGRLYVTELGNDRVSVLGFDGTTLSYITSFGSSGRDAGGLSFPTGIAIKGKYIYVSEMMNHRIQIFKMEGNGFTSVGFYGGAQGAGLTDLNQPAGISMNDSLLIVCDKNNSRVVFLKNSGDALTFFRAIGGNGMTDGLFQFPSHAISVNDDIYVADRQNNRVQIFNFDGLTYRFVESQGSLGKLPSQFDEPQGLYYDADSNTFIVSEFGNGRIQLFTPPPSLSVKIEGATVYRAKDTLRMNAQIKGNYTSLTWHKDGWLFAENAASLQLEGVSVMDIGNYFVKISNGCRAIKSNVLNVRVNRIPQVINGFVLPKDTFYLDELEYVFPNLNASSGGELYSYSEDPAIALFQYNKVSFLDTGYVWLSITQAGDIFYFPTSITQPIYITKRITTGVQVGSKEALCKVYPNPTREYLYWSVGGSMKNYKASLYDSKGVLVKENTSGEMLLGDMTKGVYILIITDQKEIYVNRITVE